MRSKMFLKRFLIFLKRFHLRPLFNDFFRTSILHVFYFLLFHSLLLSSNFTISTARPASKVKSARTSETSSPKSPSFESWLACVQPSRPKESLTSAQAILLWFWKTKGGLGVKSSSPSWTWAPRLKQHEIARFLYLYE
jgi:hypothetical protein